MQLLNVGCGTHYADGWVNTDAWTDPQTRPDVIVKPGEPYPFEDNQFDAIYMGHVLEHIEWSEVHNFLLDMNRIAKPGAPILAVGPDVYKTIERWATKQEPWSMLGSVLENQDVVGGYTSFVPGITTAAFDGASHRWNCHEQRLLGVMTAVFYNCEVYSNLLPFNRSGTRWKDKQHKVNWPVVGYWYWQCAVLGYAK